MKMMLSTVLEAPIEQVWAELQTPRLLEWVAAPLVYFVPLAPPKFPATWTEGKYLVSMRLLGLLPGGQQTINISRSAPGAPLALRDNGSGQLINTWDHLIEVESVSPGLTRYTDSLEIRAGGLTWVVWVFAQLFYRHRQRRWRALTRSGFKYD